MKVKKSLIDITARSLAESIDIRPMVRIARDLIPNYDLHSMMGIPENLPIPRSDAAKQIVSDMEESGLFLDFISYLIKIHFQGYTGHKFQISGIKKILWEIREQGLIFDQESMIFLEDPAVRRTRNWGVLQPGKEYIMTFLRVDIAGHSKLVRDYPNEIIQETYSDLNSIILEAIKKRNGRVWAIDGDGILIAFYFSNKNLSATLSAMEIINETFIYNHTICRLKKPVRLRVAVHSGACEYTNNPEEFKNSETVKKVAVIEEKYTAPDTATISNVVEIMLDTLISNLFTPFKIDNYTEYFRYQLEWEK